VRDLLRLLGIEVNAARMKPTIRVMAGEIHRVVDAPSGGWSLKSSRGSLPAWKRAVMSRHKEQTP